MNNRTLNLVVHLRTALERIAERANHQPPSGLTTDHLVGYWQGRAEGICLEARAALEKLPDETPARDITKEIALMALCAVLKERTGLHPNTIKDVQIAIDGLRQSLPVETTDNPPIAVIPICEGFQGKTCGNPVPGYFPRYCCNGTDCGCMGKPIEPCWCNECWEAWAKSREKTI